MVTADQLKASMSGQVLHSRCMTCKSRQHYFRKGDKLFLQVGHQCDPRPDEKVSWQHAADWINNEPDAGVRAKRRARFGLTAEG
jgi:hypothetical protein